MTITTLSLASLALLVFGCWIAYKTFCGAFWLIGHVFRFIGLVILRVLLLVKNLVLDSLHFVGALLTAIVLLYPTLLNVIFLRFRRAAHYGRAVEDELMNSLLSLYRVTLGHPLHFIGLGPLLDGFERRIPDVLERAPSRKPRKDEVDRFPGYEVTGLLPPGGSGAQLFVARPTEDKLRECREAGAPMPEEVVIKSFDIAAGSTLPQIVRESRALASARQLGLVMEHSLGDDHFYYVMPYVRGDVLSSVVQRLHDRAGPQGLDAQGLALVTGYTGDLLHTLERFHTGGLWHKDVKPANVIVADGHAHLVDLGLVTPLQSAMTLTTHGTEYYRDPEMVRQALQGVKVHEVDGVRFDIYSAGAVLYSMIENSFPAHGSLSRITRRCPEALQWIVRRAMADMNARYASAREMLNDLAAVAASSDPDALLPADLPSFGREGEIPVPPTSPPPIPEPAPAASPLAEAWAPVHRQPIDPELRRRRRRRGLAVAATVLFAFMLVGGGARAIRELGQGDFLTFAYEDDPATVAQPTAFEDDRFDSEDLKYLDAAKGIRDEYAGTDLSDLSDEWEKVLRRDFREASRGNGSGRSHELASAGENTGRVLVLEDLPRPAGAETVDIVGRRVRELGYEVLGLSEPGAGSIDDDELGVIAGARNAVGLGDPSDEESVLRLQYFLDTSEDLYAVFWLDPAGRKDSALCTLLIRGQLPTEPPQRIPLQKPADRRLGGKHDHRGDRR